MCISFYIEIAHFGSLGHHALKCAIGGPRIKYHAPMSHKHDKECGWCKHCLKCIAMPCFALYCCQNRFCRKIWPTGHMKCRPVIHPWPISQSEAGGHSPWPVANPLSQWCSKAFREAALWLVQSSEEDNSQSGGNLCMAVTFRAEPRIHSIGPSSQGCLLFS